MKIDELDECQGLTADMVREWLTAQKATFRDGHWTHPNGKYRYKDGEYGGLLWSLTLSQIAADFDKPNEQALLREINPRMRKGMPSAEAIAACPYWLVRDEQTGEIELYRTCHARLYQTADYRRTADGPTDPTRWLPDFGTYVSYWPCDEHGSKVRWPTDSEGKML